jgi:large subunit ribosomal protein L19
LIHFYKRQKRIKMFVSSTMGPLVARGLRSSLRHSVVSVAGVRAYANQPNPEQQEQEKESNTNPKTDEQEISRRDYRFIFPEFLPDPKPEWRNSLAEKLVRRDMLNRRDHVEIPEFYVGSSLAVTVSDKNSPHPNKISRFVGKCIDRGGTGLRAWFTLRNVIEGQGVELMYQMYNPSVLKIEVLKLEKSIDEDLYYLRDAPPEYSTVPFNMEPEILPEGSPVPLYKTIVPLNPRPWSKHWEKYADVVYQGYSIEDPYPTPGKVRRMMRWMAENNVGWQMQTMKFDMMRDYRNTIPREEQDNIWQEVADRLESRDNQMRKVAVKRAFIRPTKKL